MVIIFVLGLGLGWIGASQRALVEIRARDSAGFEAMRKRVDEEYIRRLDLDGQQRQVFVSAWNDAHQEFDQVMGRMRPELDSVLQRIDARVRPTLSPRQLAVYDRLEGERRAQLPSRPVGNDN
ncbi:hypothetical protein NY78_3056 [Desulfovibrio sp. TomC]|nr:hypothetical protein NY78_3056 [Desulfovibrio sp. TomC]